MADQIKNVFISHVHEDDDGLAKVKDLVAKGGLTVRDASINKTNPNEATSPDYIKSGILAPQIRWASTLLVYVTPKTKDSDWVNWEIEYAVEKGELLTFYEGKVAKWWIPDDVAFVDAIPLGATGKMLKARLRDTFRDYRLPTA